MVVELTGIPGSGKSTLAQALTEITNSKFVFWSVFQVREIIKNSKYKSALLGLIWYVFKFAPNCIVSIFACMQCRKRAFITFVDLVKLWIIHGIWNLYFEDKNAVLIVDGGLLHYAVTLFSTHKMNKTGLLFRQYVRTLPYTFIKYIKLNLSLDEASERVFRRPSGETARMAALSLAEKQDLLHHQEVLLTNAIAILLNLDVPILQINNMIDLQESIKCIQGFVES